MKISGIPAPTESGSESLPAPRWILALGGVISLIALGTAVAVSSSQPETSNATLVIEQLTLQNKLALNLDQHAFFREERIQRGDTIASLLSRLGIHDESAHNFLASAPAAKNMAQQLAPGKPVFAQTNAKGELHRLHFPLNGGTNILIIERQDKNFVVREITERLETHTRMKSAEIRSSLFAATDSANIPDGIATQLAELFAGDIDFHRDLRKGDRFSVVYDMHYAQGQALRTGRILSAEFVNAGKSHRAIWFEQNGKGGYYTPDGKALRKSFLRSPLEFSRVTSGFSMRFHPVLQEWRAHKGVDYAAPQGTRVRATGDAIVEFVGNQKGYGNVVILQHSGDHSTAYGHLHGFAKGLRKGSRISQGDIIGFVGQTGWATGPHLHYEFRIKQQQVNPLSIKLPTTATLEPSQMQRFKTSALPAISQLEALRLATTAAFE